MQVEARLIAVLAGGQSELLHTFDYRMSAEIRIDASVSLKEITRNAVQHLERQVILKALRNNDWNRKNTAKSLKISCRSLLYKMRDAGFTSVGTGELEAQHTRTVPRVIGSDFNS